jgi:hypothetical protein
VNVFTSRTYTGVTDWDVFLKRRSRYIFSLTSNPSRYGSFRTGKP